MEQGAKSTGAPEEGAAAASKAAQKRTKGKSRVWEKVAKRLWVLMEFYGPGGAAIS